MATKRTVRITQTCDIQVDAEYGDDDQTLIAKASPSSNTTVTEARNLLPEDES